MRRMGPDGNEVPTVAAELGAGTAAVWLLLEGGPVVGGVACSAPGLFRHGCALAQAAASTQH